MKKLTKIASVLFAMLIAAACLPGCSNANQSNQSKEESKVSTPSTSVASIAQEESKEESSESSVESSKETSKEISTTSSKETSKEESKESSIEQSEESSNESSVESSVASKVDEFSEPEIPVYQVEPKKASFKNVTRYGKVLKTAELKSKDDKTARILKDYLVSILNVNDSTYDLYWCGYSITVDASLIELFDEDYKPDFSLRYWLGIEEKYRNL